MSAPLVSTSAEGIMSPMTRFVTRIVAVAVPWVATAAVVVWHSVRIEMAEAGLPPSANAPRVTQGTSTERRPSSPTGLRVTTSKQTELKLEWDSVPTNVDTLILERRKGPSSSGTPAPEEDDELGPRTSVSGADRARQAQPEWVGIKWLDRRLTQCVVRFLHRDTDYCFRLRARNENGLSEPSRQACGRTKAQDTVLVSFRGYEGKSHVYRCVVLRGDAYSKPERAKGSRAVGALVVPTSWDIRPLPPFKLLFQAARYYRDERDCPPASSGYVGTGLQAIPLEPGKPVTHLDESLDEGLSAIVDKQQYSQWPILFNAGFTVGVIYQEPDLNLPIAIRGTVSASIRGQRVTGNYDGVVYVYQEERLVARTDCRSGFFELHRLEPGSYLLHFDGPRSEEGTYVLEIDPRRAVTPPWIFVRH